MSLIIQSSGNSLRTAASVVGGDLAIDVPPALSTGDMLVIAVSSTSDGEASVQGRTGAENPVPGLTSRSFLSESGTVTVFTAYIPTKVRADEIVALEGLVISPGTGDPATQTTAAIFRVTGADNSRFIEDAKAVSGDLAADGELTIPSFDPEYRRDNTLLFITSATYPHGAAAPRITATGSTPIGLITAGPSAVDDQGLGVTTAISIRTLSSADPTGTTPVAYSSQPGTGIGVALMLRSANRPPVINLAPEWAAEVGREAVISATVTDPDFTPVSYVWSQIDGPEEVAIGNVYARAFNFTPTLPGIYRFVLRATDVDGGRAELQASVIVPTGTTGPAEITGQDGWVDQDGGTIEAVELADGLDTTFARTEGLPVGEPLTVRLNPIYGGAAVTLTVRGAASNPSPALRRTLTLKQSDGTLISERSYDLPTVMGSYVFTTTRNETELITNRSAMTLTIVDEVA